MPNEKTLETLRDHIDEIDLKLLDLINDRITTAGEIGADKASRGEAVYRPEREAEVFRRLLELNPGPLSNAAVRAIFGEIISCARSAEAPVRVATLGPRGTFSEQAAHKAFGKQITLLEGASIKEVFRLTESGDAQFGVVPVENSTEGGVSATLDLLVETPLKACNEVELRVAHCLLAHADVANPKQIAGHEQALAQCRNWIDNNHPGVELIPKPSTAAAAHAAAGDPGILAIASPEAAALYGLEILSRDIADIPGNTTRFLVLAAEAAAPSGRDKTSLVVANSDEAGSLLRLLEPLARASISMTRIESRPTRSGLWKYVFFIDLEGHTSESKVEAALKEIEKASAYLRILGSYPRAS